MKIKKLYDIIIKVLKNEVFQVFSIILFINLFSISYNPNFDMRWGGDAGNYWEIANDFSSDFAMSRPPLFSFIIYIGLKLSIFDWKYFILLFYSLLHSVMALMFWRLFQKEKIAKIIAVPSIIIILVSPRILYYKHDLSPEFLLSFLIFTLFYSIHKTVVSKSLDGDSVDHLIIWGILCGLCTLAKPIWLVFIFFLVVYKLLIIKRERYVKRIKSLFYLMCFYLLVIAPWQLHLVKNFNQYTISNISTFALNYITLRAGFFEDTEGTLLYDHIKKNEETFLIANDLSWEKFDSYLALKGELKSSSEAAILLRNEKDFFLKGISKNVFEYCSIQFSRYYKFFNSSFLALMEYYPHQGITLKEKIWPDIFVKIYLKLYRILYKYIIPVSILFALLQTLIKRDQISILLTIFIIYYSLMCVFLSVQDSVITRFRVGIDPIIFSYFIFCFKDYLTNEKLDKYRLIIYSRLKEV